MFKKIYHIFEQVYVINTISLEYNMKIGISTGCLYPMLTEESICTLTGLGFDLFEIFFNTFSELENDYLDKLKYCLDKNSAVVRSVHPFTSSYESFLLFSSYERRFMDGLNFYDMYFRTAKRLGAKFVILHGLNTAYRTTISDGEYFRRFAAIQERADKYGVTLLQENVSGFRSGSSDFISGMKAAADEKAAFVCDTKQSLRSGYSPIEMAKIMGDKLRHVHISGRNSDGTCVLPGKGCFDIEGFLSYLIGCGYSGDIIIEVYRFSYGGTDELLSSRKYLESLIDKLQKND